MNLAQQFHLVASGQVVQLHTLDINKPYPVQYAQRLTTQFVSTVLATLNSEEGNNVKIYLPKRYANVFEDSGFEDINNGRKHYKLIQRGKTGSAYIIHMEL